MVVDGVMAVVVVAGRVGGGGVGGGSGVGGGEVAVAGVMVGWV